MKLVTRLGYVSLVDAAPLFVAEDQCFFEKYGLNVELSREVGWATVQEKLLYGEVEAAHAPSPMGVFAALDGRSRSDPLITGLILNRGGNAIVLSRNLWDRGVRDAKTLKKDIGNSRHFRKYIFATVYPGSTHRFIMYDWLKSAGIDPERDAQLVTLPPTQMCRNLKAGTIDGFCAGEPWPSMAIAGEVGWSPATSVDIHPSHPEKALLVRESYSKERAEEHTALMKALIESCAFCDLAENRDLVVRSLLKHGRLKCDANVLRACLSKEFNYGMGRVEEKPDLIYFHRDNANCPGVEEVRWVFERFKSFGKRPEAFYRAELEKRLFREDLYKEALFESRDSQ